MEGWFFIFLKIIYQAAVKEKEKEAPTSYNNNNNNNNNNGNAMWAFQMLSLRK